MTVTQLARQLRELIAALDRRVPRVGRAAEASIAPESAALRADAVKRLADLAAESSPETAGPADRHVRGADGG